MRTPLPAVFLVLLALSGGRLSAQQPVLPLSEGERIRIVSPRLDPDLAHGRVTAVTPEYIAFRLDGEESVYTRRLEFVDRLAVHRQRSRGARALRGAAWGVFLGTSAGGMSAPFVAFGLDSEVSDWSAVAMGAGGGALIGSAVGALIGMVLPSRYWQVFEIVPRR